MHNNQHIVKYNVEFNHLTIHTGWDEGVLRHCYYSGLAKHIKDIMGQQGKPLTLAKMKTLAHHIDFLSFGTPPRKIPCQKEQVQQQ